MALELGAGYVTLLPSARGFGAKVRSLTSREMKGAGTEAGNRFTSEMASSANKSGSRFTSSISTHTKKVAKSAEADGKAAGARFGGAMKTAAGVALAGMGIASVTGLFKDAITEASDLAESTNKMEQVFGSASKAVEDFASRGAKALGMSQVQARDAAATMGIFGKSAGLTGEKLSGFSTEMVSLATDLASFHNTTPEKAIEALGSAFRGEAEPMRQYGVLLDDATMRQKAMEMGLIKNTKTALTPQNKVLAAQALIMEKTKDAQGDFSRTAGGAANQQRIFTAQMTDFKGKIGAAFLPAVNAVLISLNDKLFPALDLVGQGFKGIYDLVVKGDFTGALSKVFNIQEDSPVVDTILKIRDGFWGLYYLLAKGEFTSVFSRAFNIQEDSPIVDYLLTIRSTVLSVIDTVRKWVTDNLPMLKAIAAGVLVAVGAFLVAKGAILGVRTAFSLLSAVMAINPFTLIVAAVGGLIGYLVYLYKTNDKARAIMQRAWEAIKAAVVTAWTGYIYPALSALWRFITTTLIPWIQNLWKTVQPVFAAVGAWIMATWTNTIRPALAALWGFISGTLIPIITYLLKNIVIPVFAAIGAAIKFAWNVVIKPVLALLWGFIKYILAPVISWLWKNVVGPAFKNIGDIIKVAWEKVIKPVLDVFSGAIKAIPGVFDKAQKGIADAWAKIKKAALTPVEFVVQTVLNFGLIKGINSLTKPLGIPAIPTIPWTAKLASGGVVPGHSPNPTADNIPAMLTAGEFVTRHRSAQRMKRKHPGVLEYINEHGDLPRYARGGWAKPWPMAVGAAVRKIFGHKGAQGGYGSRPGPSDHGTGNAIDFMVPDSSPLGDAIAAWGAANHAALRLKYIIWKKRIIGSGQWGKGWRPYTRYGNSKNRTLQHYDHPHFSFEHGRMGNPAVLLKGISAEMIASIMKGTASLGGDGGFDILGPLRSAFDAVVSKVPGGGIFKDVAVGFAKKSADGLLGWAASKVGAGGGDAVDNPTGAAPTGDAVLRWHDTVIQALGRAGLPTSDAYVNAWLRQIKSESGGNHNVAQRIRDVNGTGESAGVGLVQVIPGTFAAYRDKSLPNNRRDPLANLTAGMRYAKSRYGSRMLSVIGHGHGYARGGFVEPTLYDTGGILAPGLTLVSNQTKKPETVRTFEQEKAMQERLSLANGANITINGLKYDAVPEMVDELQFALTRLENRSRYGG